MEKLVAKIKEVKKQNNLKKALIGIEPSGQYWKVAAYYLQDKRYNLALVNPYHVKKIKELEDNSQIKSYFADRTKIKNKKKMVIAVQCKLARITFALLEHKKYYDQKEVEKCIFTHQAS